MGLTVKVENVLQAISDFYRYLGESVDTLLKKAQRQTNDILPTHQALPVVAAPTALRLTLGNVVKEFLPSTPRFASKTMPEATEWLVQQIDRLKPWLEQDSFAAISLEEKLVFAWQIKQHLVEAAARTLYDADGLALAFKNTFRTDTLEHLTASLEKQGKSGRALFDSVLESLATIACFVAGTPVWTDRGPLPIEQIRVGDRVLAYNEHTGEQAYKRVTRTFRTEKQVIYPMSYVVEENGKRYCETVFCTKDHPFWERDEGWMTYNELYDCKFEPTREKLHPIGITKDGKEATMGAYPLLLTFPVLAQIGPENRGLVHTLYQDGDPLFVEYIFDGQKNFDNYDLILSKYDPENVFSSQYGATLHDDNFTRLDDHFPMEMDIDDAPRLLVDVYNIEVEDFHTYYVGHLGLLAHNACDIRNHLNKFTIQFNDAARSVSEALNFKTLWTKPEASVYALEREAGEIIAIQVNNTFRNNPVGRAAEAWNDGAWGAAFTDFFNNQKSAVEYFVTFINEDAKNWDRKFLHGRTYEGLKKIGDTLYVIDRKLNALYYHEANGPRVRWKNVQVTLL